MIHCVRWRWAPNNQQPNHQIYPLWAITRVQEGGLSWTTARIGLVQIIGGFFLLVGNVYILPWLRKRFAAGGGADGGSLPLQRFAIVLMAIPGFSLFPLISICCSGSYERAMLATLPIWFLRITSVGLIFTLTFQFINGMVDDRAILGGITGAAPCSTSRNR